MIYFEYLILTQKIHLNPKKKKSDSLLMMDLGCRNDILIEAYPNCRIKFCGFNRERIETKFLSFLSNCNTKTPSNIGKLSMQLTMIIKPFLSGAEECYNTLKEGNYVIIQNSRDSVNAVFTCLVRLMSDRSCRSIEGFAELLCYHWRDIDESNTWLHIILLLVCISELQYRFPQEFEFTQDTVYWLLNHSHLLSESKFETLFQDSLDDLYDAEKQIVTALPI